MNLLSGSQRSIVTEIAGTTRDVVEEQIRLGNVTLRLSDTAGLRETEDVIEQMGVKIAEERLAQADLILAVFDTTRPLDDDDRRMLEQLPEKPVIAILNKSDQSAQLDTGELEPHFSRVITMAAREGSGLEQLQQAVEELFYQAEVTPELGIVANARQKQCLEQAREQVGKGPAVHSLRVQTDRKRYHMWMKHALELTPNLEIHQAEIVRLDVQNGHVCGVVTALGGYYSCKCVVIATGTALGGRIFVGEAHYDGGPDGTHAATALTKDLTAHGVPLRRFKTGTPARVHRRSIDFSKLDCQPGDPDELLQPFSFMTHKPMHNKVNCYIAYTNPETHKVILDNLSRSPLYGGDIQGVGPRYCPSIEDKVVRFKGKERHPVFVEPCGEDTEEMYLQGMSSSLPEAVQNAMYRTIKGFENLEIMRPAYAIEYDCVDPTSMLPTLESKVIGGMYGAGQFNGTSGYEEAAAQGLLAGLNAARQALGKSELVLARHTSYLGTRVDDLVTKGVMDPYRMIPHIALQACPRAVIF